jgi:hypothetical protein
MIGVVGFDSRQGLEIFPFTTLSRRSLGPYPMGTGGSLPGVKRQEREADHSLPSCAEVKKALRCVRLYSSTSSVCVHGMVLSQAQGRKHKLSFSLTMVYRSVVHIVVSVLVLYPRCLNVFGHVILFDLGEVKVELSLHLRAPLCEDV